MSSRSWGWCAFVLLAGCATGEAAAPKPRRAPPPVVAADANDDEGAAHAAAKPAHATAPPPARAPDDADADPHAYVHAAPDASAPAARTSADPFGDVGFHEVNQKDWLAGLRDKIAQQEKVAPAQLLVSPGLLRAAYVRTPVLTTKSRRVRPRRHEIVVVDNQGRRVASFRAVAARVGDEPPKDLRFLSEDRLVYEVVEPPEPPTTPAAPPAMKPKAPKRRHVPRAKKGHAAGLAKAAPTPAPPSSPPPPTRTFVIQPIAARARSIKCVGVHFTFSREHDHLAFVTGPPAAGFVAVDGAQIYPRRGRTIVASAPAWSKDGHSLAFLEAPSAGPPRLVLVAEVDNPAGDTTWDLPPTAAIDGAGVFWAGTGKLVVGKTLTRPLFSSSFEKETSRR